MRSISISSLFLTQWDVSYVQVWHLEIIVNFHSGDVMEDGVHSSQFLWVSAIQGTWNPLSFQKKKRI